MSGVAHPGKHQVATPCSHLNSSRDVRHGSVSNLSRICTVTVMNGSGRRQPRLAFSFVTQANRFFPVEVLALAGLVRSCADEGEVTLGAFVDGSWD